MPFPEK
jgi:hypothetical protein